MLILLCFAVNNSWTRFCTLGCQKRPSPRNTYKDMKKRMKLQKKISTHCFFQTHTFQNAPTLINGPRSRKKVRLISRSCIVCSYSGKHSTNRYTMVNRICFPAHMRSFSFPILQGPGPFFTPRFPEE